MSFSAKVDKILSSRRLSSSSVESKPKISSIVGHYGKRPVLRFSKKHRERIKKLVKESGVDVISEPYINILVTDAFELDSRKLEAGELDEYMATNLIRIYKNVGNTYPAIVTSENVFYKSGVGCIMKIALSKEYNVLRDLFLESGYAPFPDEYLDVVIGLNGEQMHFNEVFKFGEPISFVFDFIAMEERDEDSFFKSEEGDRFSYSLK